MYIRLKMQENYEHDSCLPETERDNCFRLLALYCIVWRVVTVVMRLYHTASFFAITLWNFEPLFIS